ncbi:MAG: hypothetical protein U0S36_12165 [Candidatus Nanopelagicales bacterium]
MGSELGAFDVSQPRLRGTRIDVAQAVAVATSLGLDVVVDVDDLG